MEDFRYQNVIHHLILEQLDNGKKVALRVCGKSMHPLMRKGDPVHIEKCDPNSLSTGDIITFRKDDIYVTHRVLCVAKKGDTIKLITKGDNEITVDRPVSPGQILGKVVALERAGQTIHFGSTYWRFMNRLLGFLFMLEMASILLYRFSVGRFNASNGKSPLLYRHFKNTYLRFAMRLIS